MIYSNLEISGACLIKCHHHEDSRGTFGRLFDADEIQMATGVSKFKQVSYSTNVKKGTIRGFHFQATPSQECKLISVVAGAVFDVLIDLRPGSKSFGKSLTLELSVGQEYLETSA